MSPNIINNIPKCIFLDLDGCVFQYVGSLTNILSQKKKTVQQAYWDDSTKQSYAWKIETDNPYGELLPGVVEKFNEWAYKGYTIVITTARPESMREFTENQLRHHGLFWNKMIMDLPRGPRVVINDIKPATEEYPELITAVAIPLIRNEGLINVNC